MSLARWMFGSMLGSLAACGLEGDPPTQVPLERADTAIEQAYCDRMFDCTCDQGRVFESHQACVDAVEQRVDALRARAQDTGLAYDPTCIGAWIDVLDDLGCAAQSEPDETAPGCVVPCAALHGDVPANGACQQFESGASDCAQGLQCAITECDDTGNCTGICADPCAGGCPTRCDDDERCDGESKTCVPLPGLGDSCLDQGCAPGLGCLYEGDITPSARCVALPEEGESCERLGTCAEGLRCAIDPMTATGTCVGPTPLGKACTGHGECESGYCPAGFCEHLPGLGDGCAGTLACEPGLACDGERQVCVRGDALVCEVSLLLP